MSGKNGVLGFVLLLFVLGTLPATAQEEGRGYISPGIRLGYRFGDGGGFFMGVECSFMHLYKWRTGFNAVGAVVSIDGFAPGLRFQLGAQYSIGLVGTAAGYSYIRKEGRSRHGYFGSLYTSVGLMPYIALENYSDSKDGPDFEAGGLLKAPFKVYGPRITIF